MSIYNDENLKLFVKFTSFIWASHVSFHTIKTLLNVSQVSLSNVVCSYIQTNSMKTGTKVLFFPDKQLTCKNYLAGVKCGTRNCCYAHKETSLSILVHSLSDAVTSIDVCVFTISSQELADILIKKHKDGVIIRVITDYEKMDLNCSQVEQFRANGIQVRHDKTSFFMHHKFAIVDNKTLINGSFNWTKQAITGNQENVLITGVKEIIKPYTLQFQHLWNVYKPELYDD